MIQSRQNKTISQICPPMKFTRRFQCVRLIGNGENQIKFRPSSGRGETLHQRQTIKRVTEINAGAYQEHLKQLRCAFHPIGEKILHRTGDKNSAGKSSPTWRKRNATLNGQQHPCREAHRRISHQNGERIGKSLAKYHLTPQPTADNTRTKQSIRRWQDL